MKITSTCEREFLVKCIAKNSRLDGRSLNEGRKLEIIFGQEWGCAMVLMGNTRVLAQVSAEVTEPKIVTPSEGALHINLELSSMSAPEIQQQSRISDEFVESQRVLERCIRDSKCIELESLCIVAGSKVWTIRVDIHTLNDEGNLVECCSVAAISALAHFKRPDVTVAGTNVIENNSLVPLNLQHMPISVNLALFDQGEHILIDPLELEEKIADGCYIIGVNAHQEICLVHRRGVLLLSENTIKKCEDTATRRSQTVTQAIRKALDDDNYKRITKAPIGFVDMIQTGTILGIKRPIKKIDLHEIAKESQKDDLESMEIAFDKEVRSSQIHNIIPEVSQAGLKAKKFLQEAEASIFEGGSTKWNDVSSDDSSEEEEAAKESAKPPTMKREVESSSEDEAVTVSADQIDVKPASSRGWYSKDPFA